MKQVLAEVINNSKLWEEHYHNGHLKYSSAWKMQLDCPDLALVSKPGQFIMIDCGEKCLLRRPFSIYEINDNGISIFYAVLPNGKGTNWLSQRKAGDSINLLGPLGNHFHIIPKSKNLLLVSGGNGIAPIFFLGQKATIDNFSITLLYGTADNKRLFIPPHIKLVSATEDGSVGYKGFITDLLPEYIDRADQIFACGPGPMYKAIAKLPELKGKSVQISLEVRMGCGFGLCYGCTVKTRAGLKQVCKDGPVFELNEILWDEFVDI